jgi:hypothetical protein
MTHKNKFELWWRAFPALEYTVEYLADASEYYRRKKELKKNLDDSFFNGVEILPPKIRSLT